MKLSQENIVLIIVALALGAVLWFELRPRPASDVLPTPAGPIPEPNIQAQAVPWYFGNTVNQFVNALPLPSVLPRMTVGNGAGGARSPNYSYAGGCRMCEGVAAGLRG